LVLLKLLQTPTKQQFVTATFDTLVKTRSEPTLTSILTPLFALGKLEAQFLHLPHSLHLRSLFDERVHDFTSACDKLQQVCAIYEEKYELTKSEEDLIKYVQSKADLARMHLGIHRYEDAIEHVSIALNLSNDIEKLRIFRLSAHLTAGLAHYYTQRMDESLEMFKAALSESDENPDVVCLLSQVLWAKGGEQEREVAREQLFASIEENPDHLGSILLLGTIGIMDKSSEVADAVVDDLRSFQARVDLPRKTREKIDNLLVAIAQLTSDGHRESNATAVAANAVFMRPLSSENWSRLAEVGNNRFSAEAALIVAQSSKDCDCVRLSKAYASVGKVGCDLRAIFLAPWMADGWDALYKDVKQPKKKQQKVRCKSGKLLKKQKKRKVRVGKT
jgi:superkiller protein 3